MDEQIGNRLTACLQDGGPLDEVVLAWQCYQQLRWAHHTSDLTTGKRIARRILQTFHTC